MQDEVKVTQADIDAWEIYGPKIFHCEMTGPEALARHRHQAEQRGGEVVAWMYEGPAMLEDGTIIQDRKCFPLRQAYMPSGWTETPLYARLTPLGLAVRAILQEQDHG